jgi:hypothetical protein
MGNRRVLTKLTDEKHKSLIEVCGVSGQSPSAFIRELIKQELSSRFSQSKTPEEPEVVSSLWKEYRGTTLTRKSNAEDNSTDTDSLVSPKC